MMPIVAGVFFPFDVFISPVWSAIAMSASSLIVVGFSHLLSLFEYDESFRGETLPEDVIDFGESKSDNQYSTREDTKDGIYPSFRNSNNFALSPGMLQQQPKAFGMV